MKEELIKYLRQFGRVQSVVIRNKSCLVKITKGFENKTLTIIQIMNKVQEITNNEYPVIKKVITDTDLFELLLIKP